jgi:hypothetical protein
VGTLLTRPHCPDARTDEMAPAGLGEIVKRQKEGWSYISG